MDFENKNYHDFFRDEYGEKVDTNDKDKMEELKNYFVRKDLKTIGVEKDLKRFLVMHQVKSVIEYGKGNAVEDFSETFASYLLKKRMDTLLKDRFERVTYFRACPKAS